MVPSFCRERVCYQSIWHGDSRRYGLVRAALRNVAFLIILSPSGAFASGIYTPGITGVPLPSGDTNYIQNTQSLQSGSTFYVSSGTVNSFTANSATITICTVGGGTMTITKATLNGVNTSAFSVVGSTFVIDTTNGRVSIRTASSAGAALQIGASTIDGQMSLGGSVSHVGSLRSSGALIFGNNSWGKYTGGADNDIVYTKATSIGGAGVFKIGTTGNQNSPMAYYAKNGGVTVDDRVDVIANLKFWVDDSSTSVYGSTNAALSLRPGVAVGNTWNTWHIVASSVPFPTLTLLNTSTNTMSVVTSSSTRLYGLVSVDTFNVVASSAVIFVSTNGAKARMGGTLYSMFTSSPNNNTTETDLYINTITSNTLSQSGDVLEGRYGFNIVGSGTATKDFKVYFGTTTLFDTGGISISSSGDARLEVTIIVSGTNTCRAIVALNTAGASTSVYTKETDMGIVMTQNQDLKVSGQSSGVGAATADITAKLGYLTWAPSPN